MGTVRLLENPPLASVVIGVDVETHFRTAGKGGAMYRAKQMEYVPNVFAA